MNTIDQTMKKILLILLLLSPVLAFAQKTNFSGTWQINKDKTDFAGARAAEWVVPKTIKTDQQNDKLVLTRISVDRDMQEQPGIVESLPFDGAPFQRTSGDSKIYTTLHWINDNSFTLNRKGTLTATENWTLEDEGKTLVIDRSVEQADGGSYKLKCYYDKQ
jgi:hypothetical protein